MGGGEWKWVRGLGKKGGREEGKRGDEHKRDRAARVRNEAEEREEMERSGRCGRLQCRICLGILRFDPGLKGGGQR